MSLLKVGFLSINKGFGMASEKASVTYNMKDREFCVEMGDRVYSVSQLRRRVMIKKHVRADVKGSVPVNKRERARILKVISKAREQESITITC